MLGQDVPAVTTTWMLCPAVPRTVKLPLRLPSRLMEPVPVTPDPPTVATPDGAPPELHSQPLPLRLPLTEGAPPEEGLRTRVGAAAADDGAASPAIITAKTATITDLVVLICVFSLLRGCSGTGLPV